MDHPRSRSPHAGVTVIDLDSIRPGDIITRDLGESQDTTINFMYTSGLVLSAVYVHKNEKSGRFTPRCELQMLSGDNERERWILFEDSPYTVFRR